MIITDVYFAEKYLKITIWNSIMFRRLVVVFFFLIFSSSNIFATTGCRGVGTGDLYTQSTSDPLGPGGTVWLFSSAVKNPQLSNCITTTTTPCTVRNGTSYYPTAVLVDYVPITQCPLDDSIWALIGISAGLGFFLVRTKLV